MDCRRDVVVKKREGEKEKREKKKSKIPERGEIEISDGKMPTFATWGRNIPANATRKERALIIWLRGGPLAETVSPKGIPDTLGGDGDGELVGGRQRKRACRGRRRMRTRRGGEAVGEDLWRGAAEEDSSAPVWDSEPGPGRDVRRAFSFSTRATIKALATAGTTAAVTTGPHDPLSLPLPWIPASTALIALTSSRSSASWSLSCGERSFVLDGGGGDGGEGHCVFCGLGRQRVIL